MPESSEHGGRPAPGWRRPPARWRRVRGASRGSRRRSGGGDRGGNGRRWGRRRPGSAGRAPALRTGAAAARARGGWWACSARWFGPVCRRCPTRGDVTRPAAPSLARLSVIGTRGAYAGFLRRLRRELAAAASSRRAGTRRASTLPCRSTARHKECRTPSMRMHTSSRCPWAPGGGGRCRSAAAVSTTPRSASGASTAR